ncbi:MAG: phosphoglycerate kinase [Candidatus Aenigmarchaeota archaeon]|nr:phosphoglycerate kinase [Candidatus Aenigmarchaeota archaeon]
MTANGFLTIDDRPLRGKVVLVRVDINCPVDPATREVSNDERIRLHAETTLRELREKGARTVILSHQGRPGDDDFISLRGHAPLLEKHLGGPVQFVDDIFGSAAKQAIRSLPEGGTLLLENVRFFAEEMLERPADAQASNLLVRELAPLADCFVNDAFAAIHRSQASLVGFGAVLPALAGRVMERELAALSAVLAGERKPVHFVLGGVKVKESLKVMGSLLARGKADRILTGGLLGNLLLAARGYDLGKASRETLQGKGILDLLPQARDLVRAHGKQIETPVDVALQNGGRQDVGVGELPSPYLIADIGRETVGRYGRILEDAGTIVVNSPLGRFELPGFGYGTEALLKKVAGLQAFTVVGGGHSAKLVSELGLSQEFGHVSMGGRATLYYLAGEETPVVQMLERSKRAS